MVVTDWWGAFVNWFVVALSPVIFITLVLTLVASTVAAFILMFRAVVPNRS